MQRVLSVVDEPSPELARCSGRRLARPNQGDVEGGEAAARGRPRSGRESRCRGRVGQGDGVPRRGGDDAGRPGRGVPPLRAARPEATLRTRRASCSPRPGSASLRSSAGTSTKRSSLCEKSMAVSGEHGESWHRAETLADLSIIIWRGGDPARATELASTRCASIAASATPSVPPMRSRSWRGSPRPSVEHARAARLLGAADRICGTRWTPRPSPTCSTTTRSASRRCGGPSASASFETAHRAGLDSPLAENVAYALGEGGRGGRARTPRMVRVRSPGGSDRSPSSSATASATGRSRPSLVISRRTAEGHVEHILAKLGFTSRVQVAAWVAEHRSSTPAG